MRADSRFERPLTNQDKEIRPPKVQDRHVNLFNLKILY